MTTIAWKNGVIAADRQLAGWQMVNKLFRLKDGSVVGGAGYFDDVHEIARWLDAGAKEATRPPLTEGPDNTSDVIVATPDGKAYWLTWPWLRRVEVLDGCIAVGSGAKAALGAMYAGASAKRAVEIACRLDESTGKGVNVIRVKK
jgi:hypothetical protein